MKYFSKLSRVLKKDKKLRAQVFILSTLVIVVYSVSIIAAVTELSIDRTKVDQVDVPHMVNEYLSEMNYQLELNLFKYINQSISNNTIINNLENFISVFTLYASNQGVDATINLRLNEFLIGAKSDTSSFTPIDTTSNYNHTMFISLNSSILFQSSSSGSKVSGIFINYYSINVFISSTAPNVLILTQKDFLGNTIKFISGAKFYTSRTAPDTNVVDNGNGSYSRGSTTINNFNGLTEYIILPSGLEFNT